MIAYFFVALTFLCSSKRSNFYDCLLWYMNRRTIKLYYAICNIQAVG